MNLNFNINFMKLKIYNNITFLPNNRSKGTKLNYSWHDSACILQFVTAKRIETL